MPHSTALEPETRIYVAGHRGMVGSAILQRLKTDGYANVVTRTHEELDLTDQQAVRAFFQDERIDYVVLAAAKVGGIHANNAYPAEFIGENLMIETNVIREAHNAGIQRLLFLGSSCIYPGRAPQPMKEKHLLTGVLEPANEPYAIAKIAGIKLCESYNRQYGTRYRSLMPANLYGPNDNFHPENSHVLPALMRRIHEAKLRDTPTVEVWGTGKPRREFLHVDDLACACVFVMALDDAVYGAHTSPMRSHINVGTGTDVTIAGLSELIKDVVGFAGEVVFNPHKPDGAPRKLLDVSRINAMGWQARIELRQGIAQTYEWYVANLSHARGQ